MDTQTWINVGLVVLFVLIGGVFAATEIALVSLRESQLAALERASARGARVAAVARDPNRFLAAVQIGVTVTGFLSAAYGGSTIAPDFVPSLMGLGLSEGAADTVALVGMTLIIAYLSLVLGELVPKRLALQKATTVALAVTPALDRFSVLMRPVIALLSLSTNAVVRLLGGDPNAGGETLTEEELRDLVISHEALDDQERRILRDVFAASDTTVEEAMRPRGDVTFVRGDLPLPQAAQQLRELPWSRYPVTGDNVDDLIGVLHIRELIGVATGDPRRVRDVARPLLLLPGSKRVLPSVALMREQGRHLAVVVDEYGGTDGIVTLEDLVEELVGEIRDEYDAPEPRTTTPEAVGSLDAGMTLEHFAEMTGVALPDGSYETVAGFVMARLERIPKVGDVVDLDEDAGRIEVVAMTGNRVTRVALRPSVQEPTDHPDDTT
ncbi:MAG: HlyC/CorC family transporter [Phycicoccus sp.]|nr:HlyC/CorC family transporter [Phycicoccus sp.]